MSQQMPGATRRQVLRLLMLGAVGLGVSAACQSAGQGISTPAPTQAAKPAATTQPAATQPAAAPAATQAPTQVATAQSKPAAATGGTFRIAIGVDPDTLEPAAQTTTTVQNMVDYVVETLVLLQPDGNVAPGLAESWQQSTDGLSYTFKIRSGAKFHDGADLDASAVKTSLDRVLDPKMTVPLRAPFDVDHIESVTAVDPGTLRIQLKAPFPPFIQLLAGTQYGVQSPNVITKFPDTPNEEPVGTGPYRFKERRKGESVIFERFDGYWGKKPAYPTVEFRVVPEAATRESLLLANQVEMIILPPISDIPTLQRNNNVKVILAESNRTIYLAMDLTLPGGTPLADKKVRQALNYAVDKDGIIKSVMFGAASAMDAPSAPSLFGYSKQNPYAYDQNKAKQMLQEAGWKPDTTLKFIYPTGRYVQDAQAAQAIAGNFRDVGVKVELETSDWPSYLARINVAEDKGSSHLHLLGWAPGYLDAFQQMVQFTKSAWPPKGLATSHYTNDKVEEDLSQASKDPSQDNRKQLYADAMKLVWDDAPWIFLWVQSFPIVHSAKAKGIASLPIEKFYATYAEPA